MPATRRLDVELINANVNATLEYARRLANVRSPAEFIELSTNHARKHFELIMAHVREANPATG